MQYGPELTAEAKRAADLRLINRATRLVRLIELSAPTVIIGHECHMLVEAMMMFKPYGDKVMDRLGEMLHDAAMCRYDRKKYNEAADAEDARIDAENAADEEAILGEELGYCEGDVCHRNGCTGIIEVYPPENCSCHISPPCGSCTAPRAYCPKCDWQEKDDG